MDATRSRPTRWILAMALALAVVGGFTGGRAAAGGWAVTTLDAVPEADAGATVAVGFTIRQHGVTPVDLDEGVAIEIADGEGTVARFPAVQDGVVGHYVAQVTMPGRAGSYRWAVQQGWFGPQDLGILDVGSPATPALAPGGPEYRAPAVLRYGLPAMAVVLAGLASLEVAARRRRTTAG